MAMLCAQAALAFYRCPQLTGGATNGVELPCEAMDLEAPALCKAFVQGDTQGLDGKRLALDVAAAAPLLPALQPGLMSPMAQRGPRARHAPVRARPPPLWIAFGRHRD